MYNIKKDTKLTEEQKCEIRHHVSNSMELNTISKLLFGALFSISLGIINICILVDLIAKRNVTLVNEPSIGADVIIFGLFVFAVCVVLSVCADKKKREYSLANMVSICNSYKVDVTTYEDVENGLFNRLLTEIIKPSTKYQFEDANFLAGYVENVLSKYENELKSSALYSILDDGDSTKINVHEFIATRSFVLSKNLFKKFLKHRYKERYEYEYNNPVLSAERVICLKACEKYGVDVSERLFLDLATRPLNERLDMIKELSAFKEKYKLPNVKIKYTKQERK